MEPERRRRWDLRHAKRRTPPEPSRVLWENAHLMPFQGKALDLACGLGSNALLMAARGLSTNAWDYSSVAIDRLRMRAARRGVSLNAECRDVTVNPPQPGSFDVICVSHFLERSLASVLIEALRVDGILYYQSFCQDAPGERSHHPSNPSHHFGGNELLRLFVPPLHLLVYREEGLAGDQHLGWRDMSMLVARKTTGIEWDSP